MLIRYLVFVLVVVSIATAAIFGTLWVDARGSPTEAELEAATKQAHEDGVASGNMAGEKAAYEDGYDEGYRQGKSDACVGAGEAFLDSYLGDSKCYQAGYDDATKEALDVIKRNLPGIIQTEYDNGRASAPVAPSYNFGSVHCTSRTIGSTVYTDCY